jgi:glycosyltransferase involved in cell wall biosynthesis
MVKDTMHPKSRALPEETALQNLTLSVIIPCYNEEAFIEGVLIRVLKVGLANEIIIVDDGSTDATREILKKIEEEKHPEVRIIYHERNQGKGAAVVTGFRAATGDILLIQDADYEYNPEEYPKLLKPLQEGITQVVYGSRFMGGSRKAMKFWNMVANKLLTFTTNILYDAILTDMETCYKVFRAEVVKKMNIRARGFEFEPEVTAKVLKQKIRIFEVAIDYTAREEEEGKKIRWTDGPKALWALLKYRFVD